MSDLSEKLAAIEALEQAATPGPWQANKDGTIDADGRAEVLCRGEVDCMSYCYGGTSVIEGDNLEADTAFIAASREAVPFLLALVRDQAAKLAAVEEVAERYKGIALSGTPGTMETRTAAALAAGHIRIALEARA